MLRYRYFLHNGSIWNQLNSCPQYWLTGGDSFKPQNSWFHILWWGSTDNSVWGVSLLIARSWVWYSPGEGCWVFIKTLHPDCLLLVRPRKPSHNDLIIIDRDVKPQTKRNILRCLYLISVPNTLSRYFQVFNVALNVFYLVIIYSTIITEIINMLITDAKLVLSSLYIVKIWLFYILRHVNTYSVHVNSYILNSNQ